MPAHMGCLRGAIRWSLSDLCLLGWPRLAVSEVNPKTASAPRGLICRIQRSVRAADAIQHSLPVPYASGLFALHYPGNLSDGRMARGGPSPDDRQTAGLLAFHGGCTQS